MTRQEYIDKYKSVAIDSTAGTGLFPSVALAQAIVEGRGGNSLLTTKYHNHFGVKAQRGDGWKGDTVNLATGEVSGSGQYYTDYNQVFRVYPNDRASFDDRVKFLQDNPRYRAAGVFDAKTPLEQLKALQSAKYATDPNYARAINDVLESNKLWTLDTIKRHPILATVGGLVLLAGIGGLAYVIYKKNYLKK